MEQILQDKKLDYQKLALVVIDIEHPVESEQESEEILLMEQYGKENLDSEDLQLVMEQLTPDLNELVLVTDQPVRYKEFVHRMYTEYGLLVQRLPKTEALCARGNFILDFERGMETCRKLKLRQESIYVPVYKKEWEIAENLDITVPVGYNTLVINIG